jgi:PAS domain S-box-containing protein
MNTPQEFQEFIDNIPIGIYRSTFEGSLVFCNRFFANLFGFTSTRELVNYPIINFYRNKKDRGAILNAVLQRGRLINVPVACIRHDGTPMSCSITVQIVLDEDGMAMLLDGVIQTISEFNEINCGTVNLEGLAEQVDDIVILLDRQGELLHLNSAGADFFGLPKSELLHRPLLNYIEPQYRDIFFLFLSDVLSFGRAEAILTVLDRSQRQRDIAFNACLIKCAGQPHHIKGIARDVTDSHHRRKNELAKEKFQGVLEMAGGVAHRLSQPLTIIHNLISELLNDVAAEDPSQAKLLLIKRQIQKLNELTHKIQRIKKYEAMEYAAGQKIVDIDKAS